MDGDNLASELDPWGIDSFDHVNVGLPRRTFNLLRTNNKESTLLATAHFLQTGILLNQRVTLVCFDHPSYLLPSFRKHGFNFEEALISEQLIYLYYKPSFSYALNFSTNYRSLIDEAQYLSKGNVSRIAFCNADVLFNLESQLLAKLSTENIIATFNSPHCTLLGCYEASDTAPHQLLDDTAKANLSSYLEIGSQSNTTVPAYNLSVHKFPILHAQDHFKLTVTAGSGFNTPTLELVRHG